MPHHIGHGIHATFAATLDANVPLLSEQQEWQEQPSSLIEAGV